MVPDGQDLRSDEPTVQLSLDVEFVPVGQAMIPDDEEVVEKPLDDKFDPLERL